VVATTTGSPGNKSLDDKTWRCDLQWSRPQKRVLPWTDMRLICCGRQITSEQIYDR